MSKSKEELRAQFMEMVERCGPLPSVLAVPCHFTFVPEECETEYLEGLLMGRYDGMDGELTELELDQAKAELAKRHHRKSS